MLLSRLFIHTQLTFSRRIDQNVIALLKRYAPHASALFNIYFMSFSTRTIALRVSRVKCMVGSFTVDWSIDAQQVTQTARGVFLEEITVHWRNVWTGWEEEESVQQKRLSYIE